MAINISTLIGVLIGELVKHGDCEVGAVKFDSTDPKDPSFADVGGVFSYDEESKQLWLELNAKR